MKKKFFSMTLPLLLIASIGFSQTQYSRSFYFDPISIFFTKMSVGYEQLNYNKNSSVAVFASGTYNSIFDNSGAGAEFMYRKFLVDLNKSKGKSIIQWKPYFGPYVSYKFNNFEGGNINSASGGVLFGARTTGTRIVMDVFIGGGFKYSDSEDNYSEMLYFSPSYTGFLPKIGFKVGLNF
jgi:hypothetical protein